MTTKKDLEKALKEPSPTKEAKFDSEKHQEKVLEKAMELMKDRGSLPS